MSDLSDLPRLNRDLADWWPVLSAPQDYAEEAEFYRSVIMSEAKALPKTMLELGCGGGNNASLLKQHFKMTLVDLAPGMVEVSRRLNPECEHFLGDMREVRLGRQFDAVFIHDAIGYMTTEADLRKAVDTAYEHCRPQGIALFAPDFTSEIFISRTSHGGHDAGSRSMRYLEWDHGAEPGSTIAVSDMVYLLRDENGQVRCVHDRHTTGLFGREVWMKVISDAGFTPKSFPFAHSEFEGFATDVFVGLKP